jgi:hypothetical protein
VPRIRGLFARLEAFSETVLCNRGSIGLTASLALDSPVFFNTVPKPSDPRLLSISLTEISSPSPSDILASLQYPTDSISEQKSEVLGIKRQSSVRDPRSKVTVDNINAGNSGIVLSLSVLTRGSALCILGSCFIDVFGLFNGEYSEH